MSINHFSSGLQGTLLWSQQLHPIMENHFSSNSTCISPLPISARFSFNLNQSTDDDDEDAAADDGATVPSTHADSGKAEEDKQPMFEKPLTPSDVGKLNRLVIPKQYAERYFPLGGSDSGLLLSFEDESGKFWRFRYSYWNSSQSYVLTKGWSRYVKEKRLDAGDVVVFQRHRLDGHRLYIGWKRRSPAQATVQDSSSDSLVARHSISSTSGGGWTRMFYSAQPYPAPQQHHHHLLRSPLHHSDCPHAESSVQSQTVSVGNSKILRLFGVNLECQTGESEPEPPGPGSSQTSQDPTHRHFCPHYSSSLPHHMDFSFSQDVKQTKPNFFY